MRILLLGAKGMLARELARLAPPDANVVSMSRTDLDITARAAVVDVVRRVRPDLILNAAAYTAVDAAETDRQTALNVNGTAVGMLGEIAAETQCVIVHFSSDYVFDGTAVRAYREDDPPNPINVYGESKLLGEMLLRNSAAEHLVIRTQWLYGRCGKSFPRTMLHRAIARTPTRVVNDQFGSLTLAADLADATWRLVTAGARGTYHVVNGGVASWYDVASFIFHYVGAGEVLSPCTTLDFPRPARRPQFSALATDRAAAILSSPIRPWRDALLDYLAMDDLPASG